MSKSLKKMEVMFYKFPQIEVPRLDNDGEYSVSARVYLDEFDDMCLGMTIEGMQEKSNPDYCLVDEPIVNSKTTEVELLSLFDRELERVKQRLKDPNEEAFFADNYL